MNQTAIPFIFMRGGTSRGPYFNRAHLPKDQDTLADVLIAAIGSGHPLNIDGIGGGNAVTTKVAMLSQSDDEQADIDYFFAQVSVKERLVDFKPTCGNILSAVASAAIEMGLHKADEGETIVRIRATNTGAYVKAKIQTPSAKLTYEGDTKIDGVPNTAAPVELNFMKVAGSSTGALFPTGNSIDLIDDIEVTCMDVAMPMVIARASDFGVSGYESPEELDKNKALFARMESIRIEAGKRMGMGDCSQSVTPKFGLIAPPRSGGSISTRYFMPWHTHPTMAVTGSQCLASCALTPNTVADGLIERSNKTPVTVTLEHPMGLMDVLIDFELDNNNFIHKSAGLVRTCRKIAQGELFISPHIWTL